MNEVIDELRDKAERELALVHDEGALRLVEITYLGKKGSVQGLMTQMKALSPEQRPAFGKEVNELKDFLEERVDTLRAQMRERELLKEVMDPYLDPTLPGIKPSLGGLHPVTVIQRKVEAVFRSMGFIIPDYPEAESEYFNFEALNIPSDHPARDMQDTFWLTDGHLLRTHTSPGQVRAIRTFKPPVRVLLPGKVYRYEAVDASHEHTFHQVEGLLIDRDVSVAHLIHSMKTLVREVFERDVTIRLRPGYFPFVEPGFELDMVCSVCGGKGCSVCKGSGWVEVLPCGLVHPNVIRAGGLDPNEWHGWAFGLGLSRLTMMRYKISGIRNLMAGDLRFLGQFI